MACKLTSDRFDPSDNHKPSLQFHGRRKIKVHQLPFVNRVKDSQGERRVSFWDVPATGGYDGGLQTGRAMAMILLKRIREDGPAEFKCALRWIVLEMMGQKAMGNAAQGVVYHDPRMQGEKLHEDESLRGQIVGFMSVVEDWISSSASCLSTEFGKWLDDVKIDDLVRRANNGINMASRF